LRETEEEEEGKETKERKKQNSTSSKLDGYVSSKTILLIMWILIRI
jgi:hypothetical protein